MRSHYHFGRIPTFLCGVGFLHGLVERQLQLLVSTLVVGVQIVLGVELDVVPNRLLQVDVDVADVDHPIARSTAPSASPHPPRELDELVPVLARPQLHLVSHHEESEARSRETHVHSPNVRHEPDAIGRSRPHCRVEDEVHLSSLKRVHGEDLQSLNDRVGMAGDGRLKLRGTATSQVYQRLLLVVRRENDDGDSFVVRVDLQERVVEREDEANLRHVAVGLGDFVLVLLHRDVAQVVKHDGLRHERPATPT